MNKYIAGIGAIVIAGAAFYAGVSSSVKPVEPEVVALDATANVAGEAAIDQSIRDFLERNPEVVVQAQQKYAQIQADAEAAQAKSALVENRSNLVLDPALPVIGNPNGKITLVEFFDYNCGYCRKAHEDMVVVQQANPEVRIVLQPFPILGPDSTAAHVVASAFNSLYPAKYPEFHSAILSAPEKADETTVMDIAKSFGADEAALRVAMAKPAVNEGFSKTYALASALKITGTPTYVIGDEIVSGAVGVDALNAGIKTISTTN
ncbi:MAG: DsbA family protein [Notoacmeibacter sp.]